MNGNPGLRFLAWALTASGVIACLGGVAVVVLLSAPGSFLLIYVVGILTGLLGALVASRNPRNSIGWLMSSTALVTSLVQLPAGYGYFALVTQRGAWPLGAAAVWFGAWSYAPVLAMPPLISVRFPHGAVPHRWRVIDWLAISGTAGFGLGIALLPTSRLLSFLALPQTKVAQLAPFVTNPIAISASVGGFVQGVGLVLVLAGYVLSAATLIARLQRTTGDENLQLKWFAYSGALVAAALVYGAVAWGFLGQELYLAFVPLQLAALTLPITVGIAILRYRLFDIDLIINRTLVYGTLTAFLAAVYSAMVTLLNRLFISVSGQKSDAAYVVTAFLVVVAFSPLKDWLQRRVDRRLGRTNPAQALDDFRKNVDTVVSVMDVQRIARLLVDQAVTAFDARGAALFLQPGDRPVYSRGVVDSGSGIEVALRHDGQSVGRLVMGARRGQMHYSDRDRAALQRSADAVGAAVALRDRLGLATTPL